MVVVVAGDFWYDKWRCLVQLRVYWQKCCCHVCPGINTAGLYQQPTTSLSSDECLWTSNLTNSKKIGKSNLCLCVSACVYTRTSWLIDNVEELQAGGVAVILGLAADKDNVTFHPSTLLYGRTWTSGLFGGYKGRTDLPGLVEKYMDGVRDQNPSFFSPNLNRSCYKFKRDLQLNIRKHTHTRKVQVQFDSWLQHVSLLCFFEQEKHNTIQSLTIFVNVGWDSDNQFGPLH